MQTLCILLLFIIPWGFTFLQSAKLNNGVEMPLLGYGTSGGVRTKHIKWAWTSGYRLFDTARAEEWYCERCVGDALFGPDGVAIGQREEAFIISKLHPRDHGYDSTLKQFDLSLKSLQTTYLDAFILHYPRCWGSLCGKGKFGKWEDSWTALEHLYQKGVVRAIGVSNFEIKDLMQLMKIAVIKPSLVQNYFDPLKQDDNVLQYCRQHGIQYQAYSILGSQWQYRGYAQNPIFRIPSILDIASAHNKTIAQVILRWAVQKSISVLPSSKNKTRIKQNRKIDFELSNEEVTRFNILNQQTPILDVTFSNEHSDMVNLYWLDDREGNQQRVAVGHVPIGGSISQSTYEGHRFLATDQNGVELGQFKIHIDREFYHIHNEL